MTTECDLCENAYGDPMGLYCCQEHGVNYPPGHYPLRVPTDAAVVLREDFKPDPVVARETIQKIKEMRKDKALYASRADLEAIARAAKDFSQYVGCWHETSEWQKLHIALRKALVKIGFTVEDDLLSYDDGSQK